MKYLLSLMLILESSLLMGKITITTAGVEGGKELAHYLTTSSDEVLSVELGANITVETPIELEHKKEIYIEGTSGGTRYAITAFQSLLILENIEKLTFDSIKLNGASSPLLIGKHFGEITLTNLTSTSASLGLFVDVGLLDVKKLTAQSSGPLLSLAAIDTAIFCDSTLVGSNLCYFYEWNSPEFDALLGGDDVKYAQQQQPSLIFDSVTLTGASATDDPMLCSFYINSWHVESLHENITRAAGADPYTLDIARGGSGPVAISTRSSNWSGLPMIFATAITKNLAGGSTASPNYYFKVLDDHLENQGFRVRFFGDASIQNSVVLGRSTAPLYDLISGVFASRESLVWMGSYESVGAKSKVTSAIFVKDGGSLQSAIDAMLSSDRLKGVVIYLHPGTFSLDKALTSLHTHIHGLSTRRPSTLQINVGKAGSPETAPVFSTGCLEMHNLVVNDPGTSNHIYPLAKTFVLDWHNVHLKTSRPNLFEHVSATQSGILNMATLTTNWPVPKNMPANAQSGLGWAGLLKCHIEQTSDEAVQMIFKDFPELSLFQSTVKQNTNINNDSSFYLNTTGFGYLGLAHSKVFCSTFCKINLDYPSPEFVGLRQSLGIVLDFHRGENTVGVLQTFLHLTNDWSTIAPHLRYLRGINNQVHIQQSTTGHGFVWVNTKSPLPPHVQGCLHSMMYYQVPTIFHSAGTP